MGSALTKEEASTQRGGFQYTESTSVYEEDVLQLVNLTKICESVSFAVPHPYRHFCCEAEHEYQTLNLLHVYQQDLLRLDLFAVIDDFGLSPLMV